MRYASSKIKFAAPPAKPQYAEAVEQGPTIDQLTFQILKQEPNTGTDAKLDTENLYVEIDDLDETIIAIVDKSDQKLHLYENGLKKHSWEVVQHEKAKSLPQEHGMRSGFQSIISRQSTIMLQCHTQSSTMATSLFTELIRLAGWEHQRPQMCQITSRKCSSLVCDG